MHIRDRIRELRRVAASELLPNPRNWRTHPRKQREALQGILAEIGYADALLARETDDGRLMLIDGHLRAETTPQSVVPVLVLDVNEEEANKLLVTLDPLAALAGTDSELLSGLLGEVKTESAGLGQMLAGLAERSAPEPPPDEVDQEISEQFQILVTCADEVEQVALLKKFAEEGLQCRAFVV
jgi:hypothetical protein